MLAECVVTIVAEKNAVHPGIQEKERDDS